MPPIQSPDDVLPRRPLPQRTSDVRFSSRRARGQQQAPVIPPHDGSGSVPATGGGGQSAVAGSTPNNISSGPPSLDLIPAHSKKPGEILKRVVPMVLLANLIKESRHARVSHISEKQKYFTLFS